MNDKKLETGVIGGSEKRNIEIVEYQNSWPIKFRKHKSIIAAALEKIAISIKHIGSTSVPKLSAKPIIDILLIVNDSSNEELYLKEMIDAGYQLRVREPDFHEHRMFRTINKDVHIHVLSKDSTEIDRYITFRNKLRENDFDRKRYENLKIELSNFKWSNMNKYAEAKTELIEQIINSSIKDEIE